jgi:hypothetical protein
MNVVGPHVSTHPNRQCDGMTVVTIIDLLIFCKFPGNGEGRRGNGSYLQAGNRFASVPFEPAANNVTDA